MSRLAVALLTACLATAVATAACTPFGAGAVPTPAASSGDRVTVATTIGVIADFARQVGGDRVDVHPLVPNGADVHTFDPAPSDVARLSQAGLVLMNGLGLDDWLEPVASDAGVPETSVVALAEDLDGVEYLSGGDDQTYNPHLWLDASIAIRYVERIAAALSDVDPAWRATYESNATAYSARLERLHTEIRERLAAIPAAARRVVSFHDAFPYFAAAYGLEIVGVVVEAPGQEPSAAEVAALIEAIRDADVKAILAEIQFSDALADTVAAETGAVVIRDLYTDSLGEPPVDTYEGAMRWNAGEIAAGLE